MTDRARKPAHRVECRCGWVGYRVHPNSRDCPARGCPREKIEALWTAGQGPHRSIVYLLHFHWPVQLVDGKPRAVPPKGFHACHYCGKPASSGLLPGRWLRTCRLGGSETWLRAGSRLVQAGAYLAAGRGKR